MTTKSSRVTLRFEGPYVVVFDLDDTLYPEMDFVRSGLRHLSQIIKTDESPRVFEQLWSWYRADPGSVLQQLIKVYPDPRLTIEALLEAYRAHVPSLTLPMASQSLLA